MQRKELIRTLTYAGAIPFVGLSLCIFYEYTLIDSIPNLFLYITYSAIILSFLAGMNWGQALNTPNKTAKYLFITSNVIALLAWGCLLIQQSLIALALFALGFMFQLIIDLKLNAVQLIEPWFFRLRVQVTIVVLFSFVLVSLKLL